MLLNYSCLLGQGIIIVRTVSPVINRCQEGSKNGSQFDVDWYGQYVDFIEEYAVLLR